MHADAVRMKVIEMMSSDGGRRVARRAFAGPSFAVVLLSLCTLSCLSCSEMQSRQMHPLDSNQSPAADTQAYLDTSPSSVCIEHPSSSQRMPGSGSCHRPTPTVAVEAGHRRWLTSGSIVEIAVDYACKKHPDFDFARSSCSIWIPRDEPGVLVKVDFGFGIGKPFLCVVIDREGRPTGIETGMVVD